MEAEVLYDWILFIHSLIGLAALFRFIIGFPFPIISHFLTSLVSLMGFSQVKENFIIVFIILEVITFLFSIYYKIGTDKDQCQSLIEEISRVQSFEALKEYCEKHDDL